MKSTSFIIKSIHPPIDNIQKFSVPLLDAYAIEYSILNINGQSLYVDGNGLELSNQHIIWMSESPNSFEIESSWSVVLEIFYHGIRDFSSFFPQIKKGNPCLAKRLGEFYEESENAFDNSAWLSYALMCGGIFEGLLLNQNIAGKNFHDKIEEAERKSIINNFQKQIMHTARKARNIIHANKYTEQYILRKDAMDIRTTVDALIKDFAGC